MWGVEAGAAASVSAPPQSSQNFDARALSAPHFEQRFDSALPHTAQNFLPLVLSVPHFAQRIDPFIRREGWSFLSLS